MSLPAAATGPAIYYSTSSAGLEATESHQRPTLGIEPYVEKHAYSVQSLLAVQFMVWSSSKPVFLSMSYETLLNIFFQKHHDTLI